MAEYYPQVSCSSADRS
uniref:Uncharacterized protein n=1 Tax=Arundo donax TaxID=35708 RepID=A0A0A9GC25_ARUDO